MGYFSNATEGSYYQETHCTDCIYHNDGECPVWSAHIFYSDQMSDPKSLLHKWIPKNKERPFNGECTQKEVTK